jgi:hypothetical protein
MGGSTLLHCVHRAPRCHPKPLAAPSTASRPLPPLSAPVLRCLGLRIPTPASYENASASQQTRMSLLALGLMTVVAIADDAAMANSAIGNSQTGPPAPAPLECPMRELALRRARTMQPWRANLVRDVFDSLELGTLCGQTPPDPAPPPPPPSFELADLGLGPQQQAVHVDARRGIDDDGSGGSEARPFRTVHRALEAWRRRRLAQGGGGGMAAPSSAAPPIVLHAGVHFLNATMELGPEDSGLAILNAPGEEAWLSGGVSLGELAWEEAREEVFRGKNVWVASLKGLGLHDVPGLFTLETHRRLTRARFPNADVETSQWGCKC